MSEERRKKNFSFRFFSFFKKVSSFSSSFPFVVVGVFLSLQEHLNQWHKMVLVG